MALKRTCPPDLYHCIIHDDDAVTHDDNDAVTHDDDDAVTHDDDDAVTHDDNHSLQYKGAGCSPLGPQHA